jgi:hypothetical protein
MLKTTVAFEVAKGPVLDEDAVLVLSTPAQAKSNWRVKNITPSHPEMKWIITGRGLEARWAVRPEEPAN